MWSVDRALVLLKKQRIPYSYRSCQRSSCSVTRRVVFLVVAPERGRWGRSWQAVAGTMRLGDARCG